MTDAIGEGFQESWQISKPAVHARGGVVSSQHYLASETGAAVLRDGGNAVDAAVATALHIGAVEPWMSGLGGGGVMVVYVAAERRAYAVDFTMVASGALDPADYSLVAGDDDGGDLFGWPAVEGDHNVNGPLSIAVPGNAAGLAMALERFGTLSFEEAITPAVEQARRGMPVDWYATLKIASGAPVLARFHESARTYLPGGHVPCGEWAGALPHMKLGNLADTLEQLRHAGADDFYRGDLAATLVRDLRSVGARVNAQDLANYQAKVVDVTPFDYRGNQVFAAPGLTAGPTLRDAFGRLSGWTPGDTPDVDTWCAYADALNDAYAHRLATMGDTDEGRAETCTTHLSVADREGNIVALTQTLLSVFGSKVMLPETGLLMNNGVMWFDPRPGRPNSMAPGKRPLSNMCPTLVERSDGHRFALGASGGRRIMPAVFQLASMLTDYGLDLEGAFASPRIDVSAGAQVSVDRRLPEAVRAAIGQRHNAVHETHGVYPALYACPNAAGYAPDGMCSGAAFVTSPWSRSVGA